MRSHRLVPSLALALPPRHPAPASDTLARMTVFSRRAFLGTSLVCAVAAAFARDKRQPLVASPLGDDLFLITGAGANVVAFRGPDGALLVDGGLEEHSSELIHLATKQTGAKRISTLITTHWHPEQTGSNARLGKSGTKIIAHENTKLWLQRKITVAWRDRPYGPLPQQALPTATTYTRDTLTQGKQTIEYGHLAQAHTDGDLYVYFRETNVLVAGGA